MNVATVVIAGHGYHIPIWLVPVAAIAYPRNVFSVRLGELLITVKRRRKP